MDIISATLFSLLGAALYALGHVVWHAIHDEPDCPTCASDINASCGACRARHERKKKEQASSENSY